MVQARDRRRAAVRDAAEIGAGDARAAARLLRQSRTRAGEGRILPPARQARHHADQPAQHLPSHAGRRSRTSRPCRASSWRSPRAAKGPPRGGVLDGEQAEMLRTLLAEHGEAACRTSAGRCAGSRGSCAAIRPTPSACCGTRSPRTAASPARLQAADADRAAYRRPCLVPAAAWSSISCRRTRARRPAKARRGAARMAHRAWLSRHLG